MEKPREGRTDWVGGKKNVEMKKGAGASPLFVIDAPKPVTESRIGSGHPGKPIFYVTNRRANHMPAAGVPREASESIESTAVSVWSGQANTALHPRILQNPTEWS